MPGLAPGALRALLLAVALGPVLAGTASRAAASPAPPGASTDAPVAIRPDPLTRAESARMLATIADAYVPAVPMGPTRALHTALVMPPVAWLLTEGEAGTPRDGRVALNVARLSDERIYLDSRGNRFDFDGEEQIATLEWVSPRLAARLGGRTVPFHLGASITAYSMQSAVLDDVRNWFEEVVFFGGPAFLSSRDHTGRVLRRSGPGGAHELLESDPLFKARGTLKVPLRDRPLGAHRLSSAWSLSLTSPAFGSHAESGNESLQVDSTLALAWPLSSHFRLTGAANLAVPGRSERLDSFDIPHHALVASGLVDIEWWPTSRFAVALGFAVNGPYTHDTSAPTDLSSFYLNLGLLWRPSRGSEIHLLWAENPGGAIHQLGFPEDIYDFDYQRDADFSLTLGGSLAL